MKTDSSEPAPTPMSTIQTSLTAMQSPSCPAGQRSRYRRADRERAALRRVVRPRRALCVASLAVSDKRPRVDEQLAADAIGVVVELLEPPEWEPNGRDTAPDWRVKLCDGRVADVEVTTFTDSDVRSFSAQLHKKDGSFKTWSDERLSWQWTVFVFDRDPGTNRKRRPLEQLVEALVSTLAGLYHCCDTNSAANRPWALRGRLLRCGEVGVRGRGPTGSPSTGAWA